MPTPRLVIFCSDVDTPLTPVMEALAEVFELAKVAAPRLVNILPPEAMRDAGFRALTLQGERLTSEESARRLAQHLHAVTRTFARTLREEVLGVFSDVGNLQAQACFHPPGGFPRSSEGDAFLVLRQASGWLETDTNGFLSYFGAYDVALGANSPVPALENVTRALKDAAEPVVDEEDVFVEGRLLAARELMSRYRK